VYDTAGSLVEDTEFVCNTWNQCFSDLLNKPTEKDQNDELYNDALKRKTEKERNMNKEAGNDVLSSDISHDEIVMAVKKLKCKKAVGIDLIPNEVLKHDSIIYVLWKLCNLCFETGLVPSAWLTAIILPIPKSSTKDPHVPLNYRGISLLSTISKVYTSVLNSRISRYLEEENILTEEQNGFRKGRSCLDSMFMLTSIARNRLNMGESTFAAFVDFEKAFDWVDRELLQCKLLENNIEGRVYMSIKSLYGKTEACIKLNDMITRKFHTITGVRQGDSLSPTLFNIYINDLAAQLKEQNKGLSYPSIDLSLLLYADDVVLLSGTELGLQKQLTTLEKWCTKWKMKVNIQKSQIMHFRATRKKGTNFMFRYGKSVLKKVDSYKYLGFIIDKNLKMLQGLKSLSDAAGRALGGIIAKFRLLKGLGYDTYTKLYHTCVVPIMDYFSALWHPVKVADYNSVHFRAIRFYMGVPSRTPLLFLEGEMDWVMPSVRRKLEAIRLWNRLLNKDPDSLIKKIFELDYLAENSWCNDVKNILESVGLIVKFENKEVCSLNQVLDLLCDQEKQRWRNELLNKPKLRTYKTFKQDIYTENYLKMGLSRGTVSIFAQLRSGVLPLKVEVGRYNATPLTNRTCELCKDESVEDEYHFLLKCKSYEVERENLFKIINDRDNQFMAMTDREKFAACQNIYQKVCASYTLKCWNKRKDLLYKVS
jgi:hypothetical protein